MTTADNRGNNLSPGSQASLVILVVGPKGTRDIAGYVHEATDGSKELVDALLCIARGVIPNVPVQEYSRPRKGPAGETGRPVEGHRDALDHGFGSSTQRLSY